MDANDLVKFEEDIAKLHRDGKLKYPIHLGGSKDFKQELELIKIFKGVDKERDWVFSTWRNHLHYLLFKEDPKELKRQIVENGSMHVFDDRFFTSAIVGGISSIAVGIATAKKLKNEKGHVWCFIGDSASYCGITKESIRYAEGHDLPITFVIEDNDRSVTAKTSEMWGNSGNNKTIEFKYKPTYPHAGGKKVYEMF